MCFFLTIKRKILKLVTYTICNICDFYSGFALATSKVQKSLFDRTVHFLERLHYIQNIFS